MYVTRKNYDFTDDIREFDCSLVVVTPKQAPFQPEGRKTVAGKRLLVVAGDRGGWNALEPPLLKALDADCTVAVYFQATCRQQYQEGELQLDSRFRVSTPDQVTTKQFIAQPHDLTVIGSSQSEQGARAAADAAINTAAPVLAVQDLYGSSLPSLRMIEEAGQLRKVRVCVTDMFARGHVLNYCAALADRIAITGGPQFDKVLAVRKTWNERRRQLRQAMDAPEDDLIFFITGQLNGTAEAMMLVRDGAFSADYGAAVVIRQHPRATWLDTALLEAAREVIPADHFVEVPPTLAATSEDVLPGVDFVLSGYSTTNYYGILYGMLGVVYIGTPSFRWDLFREKGLKRPPEVEMGAAWHAEKPEDLRHIIAEVRKGDASEEVQKLRWAQHQIINYCDGKATDRVWGEMQRLMS